MTLRFVLQVLRSTALPVFVFSFLFCIEILIYRVNTNFKVEKYLDCKISRSDLRIRKNAKNIMHTILELQISFFFVNFSEICGVLNLFETIFLI